MPKQKPGLIYPTAKKRAAAKKKAATVKPQPTAQPDISFESHLWEAAVELRGAVAPADYKHYVLPLLFLRYLSLRYERRHEQPPPARVHAVEDH